MNRRTANRFTLPAAPAASTLDWEIHELTCRDCARPFSFSVSTTIRLREMALRYLPPRCEACATEAGARADCQRAADAVEQARQLRLARWKDTCPPLYADTDPARLPAAALRAAENYRYGPCGLAFVGDTRRLKTRAMTLTAKRLVVEEGHTFLFVPASEFAHKVSRLAFERLAALDTYLNRLCRVDILALDDLGKGRLTDRVEAELYHVIEQRTSHRRPILWTANAGPKALAAMLSADRGEPVVRRLKEFSQIVVV